MSDKTPGITQINELRSGVVIDVTEEQAKILTGKGTHRRLTPAEREGKPLRVGVVVDAPRRRMHVSLTRETFRKLVGRAEGIDGYTPGDVMATLATAYSEGKIDVKKFAKVVEA